MKTITIFLALFACIPFSTFAGEQTFNDDLNVNELSTSSEKEALVGFGNCQTLNFSPDAIFSTKLKLALNAPILVGEHSKLLPCLTITMANSSGNNYSLDLMPEIITEWLKAIEKTDGVVTYIAVDRGIWTDIRDFLIKLVNVIFKKDYTEAASKLNAEVYYDRATQNLISVNFIVRD